MQSLKLQLVLTCSNVHFVFASLQNCLHLYLELELLHMLAIQLSSREKNALSLNVIDTKWKLDSGGHLQNPEIRYTVLIKTLHMVT